MFNLIFVIIRCMSIIVSPSLLSANFSYMKKGIELINNSNAEWVHFDIMDGSFVPNITFGHKMVSDLRPFSDLTFDVHLMVNHPETFIDSFVSAGADYITIHEESSVHLNRIVNYIREKGKKPGISIVPSTPVSSIIEILPFVDLVLVMSVNPGYGGQSIIESCLNKIKHLKELKIEKGYNYYIEIDGGVNKETYRNVISAGTEVLVTGSAFFNSSDPKGFIKMLKAI